MKNCLFLLIFSLINGVSFNSFSQNNFLQFTGKITEGIKGIAGVQIIVKGEKMKRPKKVFSFGDGTFNLQLQLNDDYLISYVKKKYHKKMVEISTKVEGKLQDEDFEPYKFNIALVKISDTLNYNPEKPVAKIRYCTKEEMFDYDKEYKNIIN
ncbi:MAG: hypothetical protein A2275_10055 [Bacteroidetes bacterium RIFOXYA12_FULL_35_11]|nr:MAG: hypothetical protein A2X01_07595 [Bacteroidetes bacterium GWF2_35_48]OFY73682.1 MAG: hypothetical protein A2275_10055 [Bacteroidetes bacterium RIFOXYA12_FULL_35_11]OFY97954.1 MAG: hypothetical protein A2491_00010 [Bacteroidetes bacterium RIFOXYC12_FULL_35_7]HBX52918.1 hypothetical protein [Bacteroidales bacterium]